VKVSKFYVLLIRVGQESLIEEEYPENEIEDELAPITVQVSYVHQVNFSKISTLRDLEEF
jgi:hypothetical protein